MDDIILTRSLAAQGLDSRDIRRLRRSEELLLVRRGAYVRDQLDQPGVERAHRQLIAATVPQLADGAVVSHLSAAVWHGLPVWPRAIERVQLTRARRGGGQHRHLVQIVGAPLPPSDVVLVDGVAVTSVARTVLDLARTRPMDQAVAAGDRALRMGLDRTALERGLAAMERWPGIRQARRTVAFLDPRSESAGESASRVRIAEDGLPAPDLQQDIIGPDGGFLARVDFLFTEQRTIGEFDGKGKYGKLLADGLTPREVVAAEKVREDALRDLDYQVVRWLWADLYRPGVIRDRLLRAFARGR